MNTEKYTLLFDASQINNRIDELAGEIINDFTDAEPLFIALMRGANPFASKLMFSIARHDPRLQPEIDYMLVSTYGQDHTAKQPVVVADLAPNTVVAGRQVVILDDVIDLGVTSEFVGKLMLERGASEVRLAVLASKHVPSRISQADYIGFEAGDKWLIGMGLDDAQAGHEYYRWLDEIWEIKR